MSFLPAWPSFELVEVICICICSVQLRPVSAQSPAGGVGAEAAYARLESLCAAIKTELQRDLHIHDQAILPSSINLPQIAAAEYCKVRLYPDSVLALSCSVSIFCSI